MTPKQRRSIENGIWLCQTCAKLVDNDAERYTVDLLRKWKLLGEESARRRVEGAGVRTGKRIRYYVVTLADDQRLEEIPCPTCGDFSKLEMSTLPGASGNPLCPTCGYFHASRDRDGEILTRKWGGSIHKDVIPCPQCSNRLQVRGDKKALSKPCLDCESILHINMGQVVSVSPMKSIEAAAFAKEGWKQLLLCPNCGVRGITLGLNKHDMLYAQCPKCRYYLKFPRPVEPAQSKEKEVS
jgi:ssDNA-binding Zn-finger/Zn-ribbon topoisomerase 1